MFLPFCGWLFNCRYLQHGSFPVISPLNETFPSDFYLQRASLHNISIAASNPTVIHTIESPLPGGWFAVAYLGEYIDDSISQAVRKNLQFHLHEVKCHVYTSENNFTAMYIMCRVFHRTAIITCKRYTILRS